MVGIRYCPITGAECNKFIEVQEDTFFLAEPFDKNREKRERAVKNALKDALGDKFREDSLKIADKEPKDTAIFCDICCMIQSCTYGIADISDLNPNVLIELGMMLALGKPVFILVKKSEEEKLREKIPSDLIWKRVVPYNEFIDIEDELAELVKNRPKLDEIPSTEKRLQELEDKIVERIEKSLRNVVREELKREQIFDELAKRLKALGLDKIPKEVDEEKRIEILPSIRKTIEELIEIVGKDKLPDDPETAIMMSRWYRLKNEYDKALKLCDWALKLDPNNVNAWFYKGFILAEMKKYEEALKCFDISLIFEPNNENTWNNKGVCLAELGKLNEALECFNRALELDHNFAGAWNGKGFCLAKLGKLDEALECFNRALELDSNFVKAWNNKGICLMKFNKYDEAEKCYLMALKLDPKKITAILNLSELYQITGKLDEALKLARKAVRMSKDNINIRAFSRYLVITALFLKGEQRKAKNEIKKLIKEIKDAGEEFKPDKIKWDFTPLLPTIDEKLSENDRKIVYALIELLRGDKSLDEFEKLIK